MAYKFTFLIAALFLSLNTAQAQTVFIDNVAPVEIHTTPRTDFLNLSLPNAFSIRADFYLPEHLNKSFTALASVNPKKCEEADSYAYALSLTIKGKFDECSAYVDNCVQKYKNIPISTIIQGARCAKLEYNFEKTYRLLNSGRQSNDFKGEQASALILEFALFAQYSIYTNQTDSIIASHPTWTQDEKDSVKGLVELLGKTPPTLRTKEQVFQFVDQQIKDSHDFLARLLKVYRFSLNLNEYRFQAAYDYLLQDAITLVNPLDWWQPAFQSLYSLSENADFSKPLALYKVFVNYANARSYLPLEQNVYTYTQIYNSICKANMLQGSDYSDLQKKLNAWKSGQLNLKDLIKQIEEANVANSTKSDLLSTYAGLLVIDGNKDKAKTFYWKAHQACPFNNRSHWGLVLIDRKNRYAAYPEFNNNIKKLQEIVASTQYPTEIQSYFINWKSLPSTSQERIKYGSRIWAPFMKDLNAANYKVYIKMPFELLSAAPGFSNIRDSRIGPPDMPTYKLDNRLWDDVRGAGGQFVISDHDETFETVQGDYNLLGHEVTHQFHAYLNTKSAYLSDCVEKMYANAGKTKSFPDPYAGTNSREYFAQGITYFLIPADAPARYGINSSWYPKNDPALYQFMISIQNSGGDLNKIKCPL